MILSQCGVVHLAHILGCIILATCVNIFSDMERRFLTEIMNSRIKVVGSALFSSVTVEQSERITLSVLVWFRLVLLNGLAKVTSMAL